MELVGQAERESITLAAVVSRELSSEELDSIQKDLASLLSDNYAKIEQFMSGVTIPSMEEVLRDREVQCLGIDYDAIAELSDKSQIDQA